MTRPACFRSASAFRLALGAAALAPALRAAEPALDRLVPADAALVVAVEDVPALRAKLSASPFGRAWADPEIEKFLAPLFSNPDYQKLIETVKSETGYTPEELLGFATGDVLLSVPLSSLKFAKSDPDANVIVALEVGDNETKIRELIAQQQSKQKEDPTVSETTEDYNGATLNIVSRVAPKPSADDADAAPVEPAEAKKSLVWTLHQGRWFLASSRELVTGALDALAAGGLAESLSTAPRYRAVLDRAGGRPDYVFFADIQSVYPVIVAGIEASRDPEEQPNPMGLEPAGMLKAFGFDTLGVVSATGAVAADGSTASEFALTYGEARGIVNLLAYRDGPVARPDWVPAAWNNVSSQNFSLPDLWSELEQILDRVSPMLAGMVMGQVKTFDRQLKIDIKRDLIGNFGSNLIGGLVPPASASASPSYDEMEQFFAVSLADAATFERTLDAIKARFLPADGGPLQKREYLGRTLHVFTPPEGSSADAKSLAYAVTDGWFMISVGSAAPLEAVFQRMNKPDAATSFWARADVRGALEPLPAAAFSMQFAELPSLLSSLCALAAKSQADRDEETPLVDASAVPSAEILAKYFSHSVTHGERKADGMYFKTTTPAAPVR